MIIKTETNLQQYKRTLYLTLLVKKDLKILQKYLNGLTKTNILIINLTNKFNI